MANKYPPVSYNDYLHVSELLNLQFLRSEEFKKPAHDEMLFIVIHQTYELWFKQILFELDSVMAFFAQPKVLENQMGVAVSRLGRVTEILKLLVSQISVLETMTPLDFLDFRDFLYPASGFQSLQFRLLENKLGLKPQTRVPLNSQPYQTYLHEGDKKAVDASEKEPSLVELLEAWLERTPFLESENFNFWQHYKDAVSAMFAADREIVSKNTHLNDNDRTRNLQGIEQSEKTFSALFSETEFEKLRVQGLFKLSHRAIQAALLISLYRDEPMLHLPYRLLFTLQDIDELMTTWRYRHALMAHRMLGTKIGTGGSSGHKYLRDATESHRIMGDLFNLATFLIPRSQLPELPENVLKTLTF